MTTPEAAYVAGILDGEGYLGWENPGPGRGRRRPTIQVSSIDEELITFLHETCGGFLPRALDRGGNRRTEYRWRIGGRPAGVIAARCAPFMRIHRKRDTALEMAKW